MIDKHTKLIPCLSHPITVIFLDDNQNFLDSLELGLSKHGRTLVFTNPEEAKRALASPKEDIVKKVSKISSDEDADSLNEKFIDFDIGNIRSLIYDSCRFSYVAVLVVDYQMPDLTGVEFCRSVQDSDQVYKVMLTATASADTAIQAFNEGVIDKFLLKQNESLYEKLEEIISDLKAKYFQRLSKPLLDNLGCSLNSILKNAAFIKLFNKVLKESNAIEYYLLDESGSYLFLDEEANPTWLIMRNDDDFKKQLEVLAGLNSPDELVEKLKNRKKLLFLLSEEEYQKPVGEWSNYLFDAEQLDEFHWYSIENGRVTDSLRWESIKKYKESINL